MIYGSIIRGRYTENRFSEEIVNVANRITETTINLWKGIQAKMLPTPKKFHYIFNLRDLSRVYQGIMHCPPKIITDPSLFVSLWKHECTRVFSDRLNDVKDKIWFDKNLEKTTEEAFGNKIAETCKRSSYFVNFLRDPIIDEDTGEIIEEAPKVYEPIESMDSLRTIAENFMKEYNADRKHIKKLDLVLFDMALKHLVRISRVIGLPRGSALLVGVGGSGKQSITRLASYIAGYETKQIVLHKSYNINNLFDDLRDLYKLAGLQGKQVTFIFTDNEIKE
jgi:dynein heavy chain